MAELFATYVQFFMEREITLRRVYERFPDFQPSDMFTEICAQDSKTRRNDRYMHLDEVDKMSDVRADRYLNQRV